MSNWKIKALEFVAKLWGLEIQVKPKQLKDVKLHNMLVTYDVEYSLHRLLDYFKENKEAELQRELATLCHNLELSFDKENEYYQYRRNVFESDNKKLKLIEILKGIEHGKVDGIYHSYWGDLLFTLSNVGIIEEKTVERIYKKIGDVFREVEDRKLRGTNER